MVQLTVVFDIDGVLCQAGSWADYSKAIPYQHGIDQVNETYDLGHHVVLQTARGMRKFKGDIAACYHHLYPVTFNWLQKHGVKFHELHFGKRSADIYADDRGCRVRSEAGMTEWNASFWPLLVRTEQAGHQH